MKVLHVIPSVALVRGGPSEAVLAMVKALREQGVEAEIATTNDNGSDLLDVPLNQLVFQEVPIWFFPRFSPPIHPVREFAFSSDLTRWLWQHISEYDLLHIHAIFSYPSTVAMAIARWQGIPYIVRPIGQLCEWSLQQGTLKKQIYLRLIERSNLNHSKALHFTSELEQQEASKIGLLPPSFILPHGLYLPTTLTDSPQRLREILKVPEDEPVILFMSRLHPKKGLDYLIPALGQLTEHRFTFVLAGKGDAEYEAEIDELLRVAGISSRTYRPGFVTGEMKQLLLQGSDMFALTSHSESFGLVVLEALACGKPAIVTPGVHLASVVKKHQLGYVTRLNANGIASAVQHCLSHPEVGREMGSRVHQLILEQYTWDRIAKKLIKVYDAIINHHVVF